MVDVDAVILGFTMIQVAHLGTLRYPLHRNLPPKKNLDPDSLGVPTLSYLDKASAFR